MEGVSSALAAHTRRPHTLGCYTRCQRPEAPRRALDALGDSECCEGRFKSLAERRGVKEMEELVAAKVIRAPAAPGKCGLKEQLQEMMMPTPRN